MKSLESNSSIRSEKSPENSNSTNKGAKLGQFTKSKTEQSKKENEAPSFGNLSNEERSSYV